MDAQRMVTFMQRERDREREVLTDLFYNIQLLQESFLMRASSHWVLWDIINLLMRLSSPWCNNYEPAPTHSTLLGDTMKELNFHLVLL